MVKDALKSPQVESPNSALKQRLLVSHELSEFQWIDLLFEMEPQCNRKPLGLLSQMLEICPSGEEKNRFFIFPFLKHLPQKNSAATRMTRRGTW